MKISKILGIVALASGVASFAHAGNGGAEPFNFLFLDANARAGALGGAYSSLADDSNALHYNPAGLGMLKRNEATFMHNSFVQGVNQEYVSAAITQGFGLTFNYLRWSDIPRATYNQPNGSGDNFGINDLAISVGYGRTLIENFSAGIALKYLRESIDDDSASGVAFDLGGLYKVSQLPGLSLGLAVQNVGPDVKFGKTEFNSSREKLPLNLRGGGSYGFQLLGHDHLITLDLAKERSEDTVVGLGVESVVYKMLALRLGYSSRNSTDVGVTAGAGWVNKDFNVDYTIVPYGDLGLAHRASVSFRWGGEKSGMAVLSGHGDASKGR